MKQTKSQSRNWLLAVPAAVLCAAGRLWQRASAFEGKLELPIPFAPATVILTLLLILSAVLFALMAQRQPVAGKLKKNPAAALYVKGSILFRVAIVVAAFLSLAAAPFLLTDGFDLWVAYQRARAHMRTVPGGNNGVLMLAAGAAAALSFVGLLCAVKAFSNGTSRGRLGILMPAVNGCLWLMESYRFHAANPIHWDYAPTLIAIALGILFWMDWAGLSAGAFAPRRTLWAAAATVVFSAVALAGAPDPGSTLLLISQMVAALALLLTLPNNLRYPPELPDEAAPAEEKLEEDTHE